MKKLCIIVGHGSKGDKGCNLFKATSESILPIIIHERNIMFDFGTMLCENIFENVTMRGERLNLLFLSKEGKETERDIVKQINYFGADLAVELHANAFEHGKASGSEILVDSYKFIKLGFDDIKWLNKFVSEIARTLNIRNRGIKIRKKSERGHYFLSKTKFLSIILEPFFLDRESDYQSYLENKDKLIMCFTQHILDFIYGR